MTPFAARLALNPLETRETPTIAIEYLFLSPTPTTTVSGGQSVTAVTVSPFAGVKMELAKTPVQSLVGWPPIKLK